MAIQKLTKARLVQQLRVLMQPEVAAAASRLGAQMQKVTACLHPSGPVAGLIMRAFLSARSLVKLMSRVCAAIVGALSFNSVFRLIRRSCYVYALASTRSVLWCILSDKRT